MPTRITDGSSGQTALVAYVIHKLLDPLFTGNPHRCASLEAPHELQPILGDPDKPVVRPTQSATSISPALVVCPASGCEFDLFSGNPPFAVLQIKATCDDQQFISCVPQRGARH